MNTTQAKVAAMPPFFCYLNNGTFIDKLGVTTAINIFKKRIKINGALG